MASNYNLRGRFLRTLLPLMVGSLVIVTVISFSFVYRSANRLGHAAVQQNAQSLIPVQRLLSEQLEFRLNVYSRSPDQVQGIAPAIDETLLLVDGTNIRVWDQYGKRSVDDELKQLLSIQSSTRTGSGEVNWFGSNESLWLVGQIELDESRRLISAQRVNESLPSRLQQFGEAEIALVSPTLEPIFSTWRSTNGTAIPPIGDLLEDRQHLQDNLGTALKTSFFIPDYRGHLHGNTLYHQRETEIPVFAYVQPITDPNSDALVAYGIWAIPTDSIYVQAKFLFTLSTLLCLTFTLIAWQVIGRLTDRQLGSLRQLREKTHALVDAFEEDLPTDARHGPITDLGSTEVTGIIRAVGRLEEVVEQRNKLESELRQAQKMESIGRLAGGIAHDFNNLLTVIVANSELLANESDGPDKALLKEILGAGRRAESLTRQLLAFSRRQVLDMQNVDLNEAVGQIDDLLRRLVGARMQFTIEIQPDLGLVHADPGQLHQVIMNLCVNARDATPVGGRIELSISNFSLVAGQIAGRPVDAHDLPPGNYVRIAVTDTGSGIPDEIQERIFEPFFSTKSVHEGTGLGLAVVKGIIEQSAGYIGIKSVLKAGSTFAVYLPRVTGVAAVTVDKAPASIPKGTGTVLLVEDEDLVRRAISRVLNRAGYEVLVASDPKSALAICREQSDSIDLILTDVIMPEMTGIELIQKIREFQPNIATLFMSGYPGDEIARHGTFEDKGQLLQKPVNPIELISFIQQHLSHT